MTKQHFNHAADIVRNILAGNWSNNFPTWSSRGHTPVALELSTETEGNISLDHARAVWTAEAFIVLFREWNPRFDQRRFLQACGLVTENV